MQRSNLTEEEQRFINHYGVINGVLWKCDGPGEPCKILVPQAAVARILYEYHGSKYAEHPGAEETLRTILEFHR